MNNDDTMPANLTVEVTNETPLDDILCEAPTLEVTQKPTMSDSPSKVSSADTMKQPILSPDNHLEFHIPAPDYLSSTYDSENSDGSKSIPSTVLPETSEYEIALSPINYLSHVTLLSSANLSDLIPEEITASSTSCETIETCDMATQTIHVKKGNLWCSTSSDAELSDLIPEDIPKQYLIKTITTSKSFNIATETISQHFISSGATLSDLIPENVTETCVIESVPKSAVTSWKPFEIATQTSSRNFTSSDDTFSDLIPEDVTETCVIESVPKSTVTSRKTFEIATQTSSWNFNSSDTTLSDFIPEDITKSCVIESISRSSSTTSCKSVEIATQTIPALDIKSDIATNSVEEEEEEESNSFPPPPRPTLEISGVSAITTGSAIREVAVQTGQHPVSILSLIPLREVDLEPLAIPPPHHNPSSQTDHLTEVLSSASDSPRPLINSDSSNSSLRPEIATPRFSPRRSKNPKTTHRSRVNLDEIVKRFHKSPQVFDVDENASLGPINLERSARSLFVTPAAERPSQTSDSFSRKRPTPFLFSAPPVHRKVNGVRWL
jgi:hypothetical protein